MGETATANYDSGKPMLAGCVKSCAATPIMAHAPVAWSAEIWPQAHSAAVEVALRGPSAQARAVPSHRARLSAAARAARDRPIVPGWRNRHSSFTQLAHRTAARGVATR